jgi:WD40 repeat protein
MIVSGSGDKTLRLWDALSGAELAVLRVQEGCAMRVVFSPEGTRILSGTDGKEIWVWDAKTLKCLEVNSPSAVRPFVSCQQRTTRLT